jgi:hypothetical protein
MRKGTQWGRKSVYLRFGRCRKNNRDWRRIHEHNSASAFSTPPKAELSFRTPKRSRAHPAPRQIRQVLERGAPAPLSERRRDNPAVIGWSLSSQGVGNIQDIPKGNRTKPRINCVAPPGWSPARGRGARTVQKQDSRPGFLDSVGRRASEETAVLRAKQRFLTWHDHC